MLCLPTPSIWLKIFNCEYQCRKTTIMDKFAFILWRLAKQALSPSPGHNHFWISVFCLVIGWGENQNKTNLTEKLEISRRWIIFLDGSHLRQSAEAKFSNKPPRGKTADRKILYLLETLSIQLLSSWSCQVIMKSEADSFQYKFIIWTFGRRGLLPAEPKKMH